MHFKLTTETLSIYGRTLFRIEATANFKHASIGDKGGWIEKPENISFVSGNAWVSGDAKVFGNAWVSGNAEVSGNAWVFGNAKVSGDAWVSGDAEVFGNAKVSGNAWVSGKTTLSPICLTGLTYKITITDIHIRIGCEFHLISDWKKFTDTRISLMDSHALAWWKTFKPLILQLTDREIK